MSIFAGGHIATYADGTTSFHHQDWLGTKRVSTDPTGAVVETCTNLPFGDGGSCTGANPSLISFTDFDHDSESNLEHAWFRQLSTTQGRWMTPDPYSGSMDLGNPQSFNRYVEVMNDPENLTDPDGRVTATGAGAAVCGLPCAAVGAVIDILGLFGLFGHHHHQTAPAPKPPPPPLSGETSGLPNGIRFPHPGIWQTIGLTPDECEFGPCVPFGNGLGPEVLLPPMIAHPQALQRVWDVGVGLLQTGVGVLRDYVHGHGWQEKERLFGTHWCGPGGGRFAN